MQTTGIRTLVGIWAHPDDESYLSAGLVQRVVAAGGRVVCVTATRGELGTDDPSAWPPDRLAALRTVELRAALATLGVHDSRLLDLADGGCDAEPARDVVARIRAVIDEVQPDAVVTFGPDGMTGHTDHITVSRWTTEAWLWAGRPGELLYATTTAAFVVRHGRLHHRLGLFPPGHPRPAATGEVVLSVDLDDDELAVKRAALAAHASQTEPLARRMGEAAFTRWWATESFRRPRPAELARTLETVLVQQS